MASLDEPAYKKCLRTNRILLLEDLTPYDVLDYLIQDGVITVNEKDKMLNYGDRTQRSCAEKLIDTIQQRNLEGFLSFLDALEKTCQRALHNVLSTKYEELKEAEANKPPEPSPPDWLLTEMSPEMRQRKISEQELALVSRDMPPRLERVGALMNFESTRVEQIAYTCPHNVANQAFKLFCEWRHEKAGGATVEAFIQILRQVPIPEHVYKEAILTESKKSRTVLV